MWVLVMALFSLCPHLEEGVGELSGVSFIRTLIPSWGLHPHDLITSQRPRLLTPPSGLGRLHLDLGPLQSVHSPTSPGPQGPHCSIFFLLFEARILSRPGNRESRVALASTGIKETRGHGGRGVSTAGGRVL